MHLPSKRPLIMGVINVTPDSFSDGGKFTAFENALAHAEKLLEEGADILDIGGESTRPNAAPVDSEEEKRRILPLIAALAKRHRALISVDTMKSEVARAALGEGANIVNDVWGFQRDLQMASVAAHAKCPVVLMHNRKVIEPDSDIILDVIAFLRRSIEIAIESGVVRENIVLDPGFGFGKTPEQNLQLVRSLSALKVFELPILLGVSRKSTLGLVTKQPVPADRLAASLAAAVIGVQNGADIIRAHDVRAHCDALATLAAISAAKLP